MSNLAELPWTDAYSLLAVNGVPYLNVASLHANKKGTNNKKENIHIYIYICMYNIFETCSASGTLIVGSGSSRAFQIGRNY